MPNTLIWVCFLAALSVAVSQNPSILEDARVHPTSDGRFGFLYRTQDGISHAAKGDPGGAVHGVFSYTDPTGLKVNFKYNSGAQAVKQSQQDQQQDGGKYQQNYQPPQQNYQPPQQNYQPKQENYPQQDYQAPQQDYQPAQQGYQPQRYTQAQYEDNYQYQPQKNYQPQQQYQPQYRPRPPVRNDIYDPDYEQRYRQ